MRGKQILIGALSALLVLTTSGTAGAKGKTKKSDNHVMTASVVFKPTSETNLTNDVYDTVDPSSTSYHQYLTPSQFAEKFGQSTAYVNSVKTYLNKYHLTTSTFAGNLAIKVKGHRSDLNKAFKARYVKGKPSRTTYHLPGKLSKNVVAVIGLYAKRADGKFASKKSAKISNAAVPTSGEKPQTDISGNQFSKQYGAAKFADHYQLSSLYDKGLTGQNQRIGIVSYGDFRKSDLQTYWRQAGVADHLNQIHKIYTIDNAKTVTKDMNHSLSEAQIEATLDVQSASAIAPDADIDFYIGSSANQATNDSAVYFTTFAQAISDNQDQQISTSFAPTVELPGQWDDHSSTLRQYNHAFNLLLEQAAAQGITVFRASGDNGPRDMPGKVENHSVTTSPYQVIVGGTTLPYQKIINHRVVSVKQERAWGDTYSAVPSKNQPANFPGGGGGFSALNPTPRYQQGFSGINTFRAIELLKYKKGGYLINKHPRVIYGTGHSRNLPDVSSNADIQTGYATYLSGPKVISNSKKKIKTAQTKIWMIGGGTSYAAPQVAAANAVMGSGLQTRIGFWNPQIYKFAAQQDTPFNVLDDADQNNNLYYTGQPGKLYNQATGLGTINYEKLYGRFQDEKTTD
ncbi:S53 family peptidase [Lentilactobacillus hilgardii]|nr:S53 family peptidase [Lentilactobacillus hilgardii]TDG79754.1 hypothetical protein C5L34_000524 [Lentilactobacillus hilgardii]